MSGLLGKTSLNLMMKEGERKGKKKKSLRCGYSLFTLKTHLISQKKKEKKERKKKKKKEKKMNKKVQPDLAFITQTCMLKAFLFSFLFLVLYCPSREIWVTIPE